MPARHPTSRCGSCGSNDDPVLRLSSGRPPLPFRLASGPPARRLASRSGSGCRSRISRSRSETLPPVLLLPDYQGRNGTVRGTRRLGVGVGLGVGGVSPEAKVIRKTPPPLVPAYTGAGERRSTVASLAPVPKTVHLSSPEVQARRRNPPMYRLRLRFAKLCRVNTLNSRKKKFGGRVCDNVILRHGATAAIGTSRSCLARHESRQRKAGHLSGRARPGALSRNRTLSASRNGACTPSS